MQFVFNWKILIFIIIFLFTKQIDLYLVLLFFAILHELGHLICGLLFGLKADRITLNPLGPEILFKSKVNDYNQDVFKASLFTLKQVIIACAGPMVNLALIILFLNYNIRVFEISREYLIYSNLLIFLFNLLPIYPLDGGRILKGILHIIIGKEKSEELVYSINKFVVIVITLFASVGIYYYKNIAILFIIILLWWLVIKEKKRYQIRRRICKIIKEQ